MSAQAQTTEKVDNVKTPIAQQVAALPATASKDTKDSKTAEVKAEEKTAATEKPSDAQKTEAATKLKTLATELLKKNDGNKSATIRELTAKGHDCGPIAKALGILHQFAYNVRKRPLKRD